jgi:hypothetical protein
MLRICSLRSPNDQSRLESEEVRRLRDRFQGSVFKVQPEEKVSEQKKHKAKSRGECVVDCGFYLT